MALQNPCVYESNCLWNADSDGAVHTIITLLCVEKFRALQTFQDQDGEVYNSSCQSAKEAAKVKVVPKVELNQQNKNIIKKTTLHELVIDKPVDIS